MLDHFQGNDRIETLRNRVSKILVEIQRDKWHPFASEKIIAEDVRCADPITRVGQPQAHRTAAGAQLQHFGASWQVLLQALQRKRMQARTGEDRNPIVAVLAPTSVAAAMEHLGADRICAGLNILHATPAWF